MKENILITRVIGPILDSIGSKPREVNTVGNVTEYELIDRTTGEVVGYELIAVRDGVSVIRNFVQSTTLRKKLLGRKIQGV